MYVNMVMTCFMQTSKFVQTNILRFGTYFCEISLAVEDEIGAEAAVDNVDVAAVGAIAEVAAVEHVDVAVVEYVGATPAIENVDVAAVEYVGATAIEYVDVAAVEYVGATAIEYVDVAAVEYVRLGATAIEYVDVAALLLIRVLLESAIGTFIMILDGCCGIVVFRSRLSNVLKALDAATAIELTPWELTAMVTLLPTAADPFKQWF